MLKRATQRHSMHHDGHQGEKKNFPKKINEKRNVGKIILAIVIFGFILASIIDENSGDSNYSNYSPPIVANQNQESKPQVPDIINNNDEDEVAVGQYICSSYHANAAERIQPSSYTSSLLDSQKSEIDRMERELKNTYVDEYSEYSVNSYNQKLATYKTKINNLNAQVDNYNREVDTYNNYLTNNCRKKY